MASPIPAGTVAELAAVYGTPFWVYDAATIRTQVQKLRAFDVVRYAQKACSNIHILALVRSLGAKVDAVSLGELQRSQHSGYSFEDVVFTSDLIDENTLEFVVRNGITVNAGSIDMLKRIGQSSPGHRVWIRVNPGFGHGHSQKTNTGGEASKHGIWHHDLHQVEQVLQENQYTKFVNKIFRLRLIGMHMHIGSGTDFEHLALVCNEMVNAVTTLGMTTHFEAISAGGGLPVSYEEEGEEIDVDKYFNLWNAARNKIEVKLNRKIKLEIEPGRFLLAESGCLLAKVQAIQHRPNIDFLLLDAGFNDLVRPAMYGSKHRITLLNAKGSPKIGPSKSVYVAGPLCESGDVFTQIEGGIVKPITLPQADIGDIVLFHTAGAYGSSMSSNYNSRGLAPEILLDEDHKFLIRRRQTVADLIGLEENVEL